MSKVAVLAKLRAAPGKREELVKELQFALDNVQHEAGTEVYLLHEDAKDDDAIWFYEVYTDQGSFEAHGSADWFKAMGPKIGPLMGGRPELTFLRPLGGKGL